MNGKRHLFNLIVIGDEILHGSRSDAHFAFFKSLLESRGLLLNQVQYLPDDRAVLVRQLARSFSDGLPTFVTGGIGATPDDHTRQAAAEALGLPLALHREAAKNIDAATLKRGESLQSPEHLRRLKMAEFPQGAEAIPNPFNNISGFGLREHYFLPGFPVMAHPMAEWVLQQHYAGLFHRRTAVQKSIWLSDTPESRIAPVMEYIEAAYPGIRTFSLPHVGTDGSGGKTGSGIEFGIKAEDAAAAAADEAWAETLQRLRASGVALPDKG